MIDSIRRAFGFYDSYGLKYSTAHLAGMKSIIATVPRSRQAQYVDQVTKNAVDTSNSNMRMIEGDLDDTDPSKFALGDHNTTSVGNLAYVALYYRNSWYANKAEACLQALADHELKKNQLSNE